MFPAVRLQCWPARRPAFWLASWAVCSIALAACSVSEAREHAPPTMRAREAPGQAAAPAATGPVVLELFTSQGCSSCPPADRLLAELGQRDDVIALSFHVDYWNDLGWKDPFSSPRWSSRQQAYGDALSSGLYTPQIVIQGRQHMVGSKENAVRQALAAQAAQPRARLQASASRQGNQVKVAIDRDARDLLAVVALYESEHRTKVTAGENRSRTLHNQHVVRQLAYAEKNDAVTIDVDPSWAGALGVAVLLQDLDTMAIHAATKLSVPER